MFRIDDATAATSLPTPESAGTEGYFTEGNPAAGTPATNVRGSWLNMIQEELRAIVVAGGLTPSKTSYNQVLTAIQTLFAGSNGNSANAFSVAAATQSSQAVNLGQFPATIAANGYVTIPVIVAGVKRNLIIQWGSAASNSSGIATLTLPIAFPNAYLLGVANYLQNGNGLQSVAATISTNTSLKQAIATTSLSNAAVNAATANFIVIGW
ncbi:gp53-like domain-containing protein [Paraburkholderia atlantica]|uniref:gp53-like domain-containing protein n=1 Tax=Paraburkholderia atlantica TaxID=2654982 RepID=UPI001621B902|nr:hypothetical protein [Paraburkholderia atlantica]MBB5414117.1 hypothetical protein [Paraburkholderia atlantica]